jgi:predicted nucleotidyltransferase
VLDVFVVAETLVNHIRSKCPDDIAIIAYYGSFANGTATKRSDLDFFFIPATSNGYHEEDTAHRDYEY